MHKTQIPQKRRRPLISIRDRLKPTEAISVVEQRVQSQKPKQPKRKRKNEVLERSSMEDLWKRAKGFAEEAAKKSQSLTNSAKISDLVSETAKKSMELAAEASKQADLLKTAALKQADQIKSFSSDILVIPPQLSSLSISNPSSSSSSSSDEPSQSELIKFGLTNDLIVFVKGLTSTTFQSFPIQGVSHSNAQAHFGLSFCSLSLFW